MANNKKICVVTNYRTGSTAFTLLKHEEYGVPYGAEAFAPQRPEGLGRIPSRREIMDGYKIFQYEILDLIQSTPNYITELQRDNTEICFKIMPNQIDSGHLREVVKACDKVYYLYRRDFIAQCKSWIAVRRFGDFGNTGFESPSRNFTLDKVKEQHLARAGLSEKVIVEIDPDDPVLNGGYGEVTIPNLIRQLKDCYLEMAKLYKEIPGELICMEDYFTRELKRPYNKQVNFTKEIEIEDFDVESLFTIDNT